MRHSTTVLAIGGASLFLALPVQAQEDAAEAQRFDSAIVRLAASGAVQNRPIPSDDPTGLAITSMNLTWLVYTAYEEGLGTAWKVQGGPDWADTTTFAIEAQAPRASTSHELRIMLRTLLAERFRLQVREETVTPEVYTLVLDRIDGTLGPNIRAWDGTCGGNAQLADDDPYIPRCPSGYTPRGLMIEGGTMYAAADALSLPPTWGRLGGNMVQDHTGLTGRYTMRLEFPFGPWNQPRSQDPDETSKELIEAVREQWGLRIEKGIGVLHIVEIEHAEMPNIVAGATNPDSDPRVGTWIAESPAGLAPIRTRYEDLDDGRIRVTLNGIFVDARCDGEAYPFVNASGRPAGPTYACRVTRPRTVEYIYTQAAQERWTTSEGVETVSEDGATMTHIGVHRDSSGAFVEDWNLIFQRQ